MEMTKEIFWKILNGGFTLPEMMLLAGREQEDVNDVMKLMEELSSDSYFYYAQFYRRVAYLNLVEMGEIDGNKVFPFNGERREGDIGWDKDHQYIWNNGSWILF